MESLKKEEESVTRHCAYCLNVCGLPIKLCGGCKKRAYCSKECQRADWSIKGNGQRHVNWCRRHECGEEDVDWEVVPIPNKGLGIRAKKLIPAGLKIIVEPVFLSPNDHPGVMDLEPKEATLQHKFKLNRFMAENLESQSCIALRIARLNHACQPNAVTIYDETARVAILFAQKDIQPGEEISVSYYFQFFRLGHINKDVVPGANDFTLEHEVDEFNFIKNLLAESYGITCSAGCFCHDPATTALTKEGRKTLETASNLSRQCKIEEALAAGEKLLDIHRRLNVSWINQGFTQYLLFRIAVQKSETIPRAKEYIRSAIELFRNICPYSERITKKFEELLEHPEMDPNYMLIDKMQDMSSVIGQLLSGLNL